MCKLDKLSAKKLLGWEYGKESFPEAPALKQSQNRVFNEEDARLLEEIERDWQYECEVMELAGETMSRSLFGSLFLIEKSAEVSFSDWAYEENKLTIINVDGSFFELDTRSRQITTFNPRTDTWGVIAGVELNKVLYWLVLDEAQDRAETCIN